MFIGGGFSCIVYEDTLISYSDFPEGIFMSYV
jgi:hypothetical protein